MSKKTKQERKTAKAAKKAAKKAEKFACAHFKDASPGWHSALPNDFVFPEPR
jgi:hypothetical protein